MSSLRGAPLSTNFPTQNGLYTQESAVENAFIAKLNPAAANAASLIWSTYLGGNVTTGAYGVAVDSQNNVYVTGDTSATNFPVTMRFRVPYRNSATPAERRLCAHKVS